MEEAKLLRGAEEEAKKAARLRSELEVKLDKAEEKARREAERILTNARAEAERTFDELARLRQELELQSDHRRVNDARSETLRRLNAAREAMRKQEEEASVEKSARPVEVGDVVAVQAMGGAKATVLSISADRVLQLQVGILKLSAREDEVTLLINEKPKPVKVQSSVHATLRKESTSSELDIRGMETLEAVPIVERYIDSCSQNGLETVTIIHGKGTGALRTAVQQSLKRHKLVKSFRLGRYGEGESGVTVVELK